MVTNGIRGRSRVNHITAGNQSQDRRIRQQVRRDGPKHDHQRVDDVEVGLLFDRQPPARRGAQSASRSVNSLEDVQSVGRGREPAPAASDMNAPSVLRPGHSGRTALTIMAASMRCAPGVHSADFAISCMSSSDSPKCGRSRAPARGRRRRPASRRARPSSRGSAGGRARSCSASASARSRSGTAGRRPGTGRADRTRSRPHMVEHLVGREILDANDRGPRTARGLAGQPPQRPRGRSPRLVERGSRAERQASGSVYRVHGRQLAPGRHCSRLADRVDGAADARA